MINILQITYCAVLFMIAGIVSYYLAEKFGLPRVALLLIIGFLYGIHGLFNRTWFDPTEGSDFPLGTVVQLILIMVLFYGGYSVDIKNLQGVLRPGVLLATIGTFITASCVALLVGFAFPAQFGLITAIIIGTLISPIDPIAVFSAQDTYSLHPKVNTISKFQSGLDDTMVTTIIILICIPLGLAVNSGQAFNSTEIILQALGQFIWLTVSAVIIGVGLGYGFFLIYKKIKSELRDLVNIILPFLTYTIASIPLPNGQPLSSGFVSVFIAGIIFGRNLMHSKEEYEKVKRIWGYGFRFCEIFTFVILGSLVRPEIFGQILGPALLIAALIIFVTAPMAVSLCTIHTGLNFRDRLYLSYIGLKGLDPAVLAIAAFESLQYTQHPYLTGIDLLINITFTLILLINIGQITMLTILFGKSGIYTKKAQHNKSQNSTLTNECVVGHTIEIIASNDGGDSIV